MKIVKAAVGLLLGVLLITAFACSGGSSEQGSTPTPTPAWATYSNSSLGISIQYPQDWTKVEGAAGTVVTFQSPQSSASDDFLENLNIVVEDLSSQPMTLSEYVELNVNMLKQYIPSYKLIDSSSTTLAGMPAQKLVYTGELQQYALKWMQIISIKNNVAYVISYTATESSYSSNLETAQHMIDSFRFD